MGIEHVEAGSSKTLQQIADLLAKARKIVAVTGAGISTSCGIPDFQSADGLYSQTLPGQQDGVSAAGKLRAKASKPIKAKDLFDARLWSSEASTAAFYHFIASFRARIEAEVASPSATHRFLRTLRDRGKLVRCYTQNIDGLERRDEVGLCSDLRRGPGRRARFSARTKKAAPALLDVSESGDLRGPNDPLDAGCEAVPLHGDLERLRCTICRYETEWSVEAEGSFLAGTAPECPACMAQDESRRRDGKRGQAIGTLRPNIVLYGEEHPSVDAVSKIVTHDLSLAPDVLLIVGTSLRVHGLKKLVKEFAKAVHARPGGGGGGGGKVVFVNATAPAQSVWKDVIDVWVDMDCDAWVEDLRTRRPELWMRQTDLKRTKGGAKVEKPGVATAKVAVEKKEKKNCLSEEEVRVGDEAMAVEQKSCCPNGGVKVEIPSPKKNKVCGEEMIWTPTKTEVKVEIFSPERQGWQPFHFDDEDKENMAPIRGNDGGERRDFSLIADTTTAAVATAATATKYSPLFAKIQRATASNNPKRKTPGGEGEDREPSLSYYNERNQTFVESCIEVKSERRERDETDAPPPTKRCKRESGGSSFEIFSDLVEEREWMCKVQALPVRRKRGLSPEMGDW